MRLDESDVDDFTNQRHYGWALTGRARVSRDTFIRGRRYLILPALTYEGIVALDIFEESASKERFIQFLRDQIVSLYSALPPNMTDTYARLLNSIPTLENVMLSYFDIMMRKSVLY